MAKGMGDIHHHLLARRKARRQIAQHPRLLSICAGVVDEQAIHLQAQPGGELFGRFREYCVIDGGGF